VSANQQVEFGITRYLSLFPFPLKTEPPPYSFQDVVKLWIWIDSEAAHPYWQNSR